jgi:hypothetical protein
MDAAEREQAAAAMQQSGAPLSDDHADGSDAAKREAKGATIKHPQVTDEVVDESHVARWHGYSANEVSGADLEQEPVDDGETARREARQANPHEAPRDDVADDSETAHEDARRANEPPQ